MCYVHSALHLRMVGWVGDPIEEVEPRCYADADLGGCVRTQRSTAGTHLVMRGPHTCFPIAAGSKKDGLRGSVHCGGGAIRGLLCDQDVRHPSIDLLVYSSPKRGLSFEIP